MIIDDNLNTSVIGSSETGTILDNNGLPAALTLPIGTQEIPVDLNQQSQPSNELYDSKRVVFPLPTYIVTGKQIGRAHV